MLDRTETPAFHLVISLITAAARAVVRARATDVGLLSFQRRKHTASQCLAQNCWLITEKAMLSKCNHWRAGARWGRPTYLVRNSTTASPRNSNLSL